MDHSEMETDEEVVLPPDPRPFSEQRPGAHRVAYAQNPDRLLPSLAPGAGSVDVTWPVEHRETWYCDTAVNALTHPHLAPYLYSTPEFARAHSKQISTISVWTAGRAWAITGVSNPAAAPSPN